MRVRGLFVIVTVAGLVAAMPVGGARAGGNWLDIRREGGRWGTWSGPFVPGTSLEVRATLYTPGSRAGRLRTSGPYFAWIAPQSGRVDVNGLPAGAIRLSAFELRWTSSRFAVARASFLLPALPSGRYTIEVCNDLCRLSGFGEFVQGWTSVVQTAEAVTLQHQKEQLRRQLMKVRQEAGRARRDAESVQADLNDSEATRASLTARIAVLTDELGVARRRAQTAAVTDGRPLVDPWIGLLLAVAALSLAGALVNRRRPGRIVVPDTPEELLGRDELERPGVKR